MASETNSTELEAAKDWGDLLTEPYNESESLEWRREYAQQYQWRHKDDPEVKYAVLIFYLIMVSSESVASRPFACSPVSVWPASYCQLLARNLDSHNMLTICLRCLPKISPRIQGSTHKVLHRRDTQSPKMRGQLSEQFLNIVLAIAVHHCGIAECIVLLEEEAQTQL